MAASDQRLENSESHKTLIIIVAVAAAVLIALFFYMLMRAGGSGTNVEPTLQGAIRPGNPEFDKQKANIVIDDVEADEAKRALGDIVMSLRGTIRNLTGKTINGLEVRAAVVDYDGNPVRERTAVIIPTRQGELAPNKILPVQMMLEGMKDTDARANIQMEVVGFRFKD